MDIRIFKVVNLLVSNLKYLNGLYKVYQPICLPFSIAFKPKFYFTLKTDSVFEDFDISFYMISA